MSSYKDSKLVAASIESTAQACRFAFNEMKILVKKDRGTSFQANEKVRFGFSNPAKLEVDLLESGNETRLNVKASNFGMGPIQVGHVKAAQQKSEHADGKEAEYGARGFTGNDRASYTHSSNCLRPEYSVYLHIYSFEYDDITYDFHTSRCTTCHPADEH